MHSLRSTVDYLLGPVSVPSLAVDPDKYRRLRSGFLVAAWICIIGSVTIAFDSIAAVDRFQDNISEISLRLIHGEVFMLDLYVVAVVPILGVMLLPAPGNHPRRTLPRFSVFGIGALAFATVLAIAVGYASGFSNLFAESRIYVYGVVTLLLPIVFPSIRLIRRFIVVYIAIATLSLLADTDLYSNVSTGTYNYFLSFRNVLVLPSVVAFGIALDSQFARQVRAAAAVVTLLILVGLIFDVARGPIIGVFIGFVILVAIHSSAIRQTVKSQLVVVRRRGKNSVVMVVGIAVVIGLVIAVFAPIAPAIVDRFGKLSDTNNSPSTALRIEGFKQGMVWWQQSPLVGKGAGFDEKWYVPYKQAGEKFIGRVRLEYRTLHNFYVMLLVYGGLVGAVALLFPILMVSIGLIRLIRKPGSSVGALAAAAFASMAAVLFMVAPSLLGPANSLMVWFAVGLGVTVVTASLRTQPESTGLPVTAVE